MSKDRNSAIQAWIEELAPIGDDIQDAAKGDDDLGIAVRGIDQALKYLDRAIWIKAIKEAA